MESYHSLAKSELFCTSGVSTQQQNGGVGNEMFTQVLFE